MLRQVDPDFLKAQRKHKTSKVKGLSKDGIRWLRAKEFTEIPLPDPDAYDGQSSAWLALGELYDAIAAASQKDSTLAQVEAAEAAMAEWARVYRPGQQAEMPMGEDGASGSSGGEKEAGARNDEAGNGGQGGSGGDEPMHASPAPAAASAAASTVASAPTATAPTVSWRQLEPETATWSRERHRDNEHSGSHGCARAAVTCLRKNVNPGVMVSWCHGGS
jgi:hypothetical protein